jgi:hypothetical protein
MQIGDTDMTTQQARRTLAETYAARATDIDALLDLIQQQMQAHKEEAAAKPRDWGFAGDLEHVRARLSEVLSSLSGMEETTINETLEDLRTGR